MFALFKKMKTAPVQTGPSERIVHAIVSKTLVLQERWAAFMQRRTEKLSAKSKKWAIILFCLLAGGYSLYIMTESFSLNPKKSFFVINIQTPKYLTHTGEENVQRLTVISPIEYKKIQNFRAYMDRLNKSIGGRKTADSILLRRPGLMDSILQLEQLYHLQPSSKK